MITYSLAPWLTVEDGAHAFEFYTAAFAAVETYRLEAPDGSLILRFSVGGAEFWISGGPAASPGSKADGGLPGSGPTSGAASPGSGPTSGATSPVGGESIAPLGAGTIRMILTVPDPEAFFARSVQAGAVEVFPVGEAHGWKLGRIMDPFGLHWEIGHPVG